MACSTKPQATTAHFHRPSQTTLAQYCAGRGLALQNLWPHCTHVIMHQIHSRPLRALTLVLAAAEGGLVCFGLEGTNDDPYMLQQIFLLAG